MSQFNKYGEIIPDDNELGQAFQRDDRHAGPQALFNPLLGVITVFLSILLMLGFMTIYKTYKNIVPDTDYFEAFTQIERLSQDEYKNYITQNSKFPEFYRYNNAENLR
ncbi:MAG: hypothetical protein HZA10_09340 [Nitrospirae bacterium]|nr:hypothetical protein [Nitrospirota bacterium]